MTLNGPGGDFYVRPEMVCSVGPSHRDYYHFPSLMQDIRVVTTVGGSAYYVYDNHPELNQLLKPSACGTREGGHS